MATAVRTRAGGVSTVILIVPGDLRKAAGAYRDTGQRLGEARSHLQELADARPLDRFLGREDALDRANGDLAEQIEYIAEEAESLSARASWAERSDGSRAELDLFDQLGLGGRPELGTRYGQGMRPNFDRVQREYQTFDDGEIIWPPIPKIGKKMTVREREMFLALSSLEKVEFVAIYRTAEGVDGGNVDRGNAYKHALWSALLARRFGENWARDFTTAHEGVRDPRAIDRLSESMDLYNNDIGRQIVKSNPGASEAQIRVLIKEALDRGDLVVVDDGTRLAWSDQVPD